MSDIRSKIEALLKRRDSEFERLTVAERWYIDQLESLVEASVALVERQEKLIKELEEYGAYEVEDFFEEPWHCALYRKGKEALAAFTAEVENVGKP